MTDYQDPTLSRRGFAQAVVAGSLLGGFSRAAAGAPFANLPRLDGELSFDPILRADYANDYGRIIHEQPLAVLRPGSVRDIASIVNSARRFGLKIVARGQGHQPFVSPRQCSRNFWSSTATVAASSIHSPRSS